jgi:hypothetical protein
MSNMEEKMEATRTSNGCAKCSLRWFMDNILNGWITEMDYDEHGPRVIRIHRKIAKQFEMWHRISIGKDPMFELRETYKENQNEDKAVG